MRPRGYIAAARPRSSNSRDAQLSEEETPRNFSPSDMNQKASYSSSPSGGGMGERKQYAGLTNRITDPDKGKLWKLEGHSTAPAADPSADAPGDYGVGGSGSGSSSQDDNMLEEFFRKPMSFGTDNLTVVTGQVGATAFLPCRVHFIGDGVVSMAAWRQQVKEKLNYSAN